MKKKDVLRIIEILEELYPQADCELHFESVFQLLISVILSAQTTDKKVNEVTTVLFAKYPDLDSMLTMDQMELEEMIRQIGMYRTKSANIMKTCLKLKEEFDGQVPGNYDDLLTLPGVGRKTANVVLANGFGKQAIAVDTHVFRVSNKIGLVHEKDVLKTELSLMKVLPEDKWTLCHHMLIWHGRRVCAARNPKCDVCKINEYCEHYQIEHKKVKTKESK